MMPAITQVKLSDIVIPHFQPFWKASNSHKYLKHVLKGGRGSGKSTGISEKLIVDMMKYPVTALCIRKVGRTLGESVFEQLKEAIEILGVSAYWKEIKNPLQLIYLPRGNKIIFRGADDPVKIKSIKMAKFPIAFLWIEELPEFKTEDEVSTIENSVLRAELPDGLFYAFYYSYNPPKRKQSWVNQKYESQFISGNTYVHHSTYLNNPFISKAFKDEAEAVKHKGKLDKDGISYKYKWEYLGKAIGSGVVPFDNLVFRRITDEEIKAFDNIRQGIDWGYGVDPLSFGRWHYDKTRRKLYAIDELYGVKISNREAAIWIKERKYHTDMTIADSAEPKSIDEMKTYGLRIKGAKKGPGSVEYGEKWLDDLEEIVIDPIRTPSTAKEFEDIDYQVDSDGNPRAKLEDTNNHCLTGDMMVDTIGGPVAIKELTGKEGLVHCFDEVNQRSTVSAFYDCRMTQSHVDIFEIELEDGRIIKATKEHPVLTRSGWRQVKDLTDSDYILDIFCEGNPGGVSIE